MSDPLHSEPETSTYLPWVPYHAFYRPRSLPTDLQTAFTELLHIHHIHSETERIPAHRLETETDLTTLAPQLIQNLGVHVYISHGESGDTPDDAFVRYIQSTWKKDVEEINRNIRKWLGGKKNAPAHRPVPFFLLRIDHAWSYLRPIWADLRAVHIIEVAPDYPHISQPGVLYNLRTDSTESTVLVHLAPDASTMRMTVHISPHVRETDISVTNLTTYLLTNDMDIREGRILGTLPYDALRPLLQKQTNGTLGTKTLFRTWNALTPKIDEPSAE